jgi:hypothetical protein
MDFHLTLKHLNTMAAEATEAGSSSGVSAGKRLEEGTASAGWRGGRSLLEQIGGLLAADGDAFDSTSGGASKTSFEG